MSKFHSFLALALACVGCGASFSANDGSGGSAGSGQAGSGQAGSGQAGSGQAGEASGGVTSSAGSPSMADAGAMDVGGSSAAGQPATAGSGGSTGSTGGRSGWGNGGQGSGGWRSGMGGGPWGGADCDALRQDYTTAVDKARVCDKGSTDECSPTSVAQPVGGCSCPVLVNAKSEYTATAKKAYQAYQDAKCGESVLCDVFCTPAVSASCAQQGMAPGNTFVCTAGIAIQN